MRRLLVLTFALLGCPSLGVAQSAPELIEQGVALREDGRDEEALALFERAYQDAGSGESLAQIALAEQALGRPVEAEAHLVSALAQTDDRFVRRHRAALQQALDELREGLGDLQIEGESPPGAVVWIGDASRGALPLAAPIRVPLGAVQVEIRAPGFTTQASTVEVAPGVVAHVAVALTPLPSRAVDPAPVVEAPAPAPSPPPPPRGDTVLLPVGIALASVGVIGLGVATGMLVLREDSARARLTCSDADAACRAQYQTALDAEAASIALYVVGGALLAAGAVLLALELTTDDPGERSALACVPGALSLACAGRF